MEKFEGKLEAVGRVGLRDNETKELIAVYPYKAIGTDSEIEEKVKFWFYQRGCEAENELLDYHVDSLNPAEIKNALEKFRD